MKSWNIKRTFQSARAAKLRGRRRGGARKLLHKFPVAYVRARIPTVASAHLRTFTRTQNRDRRSSGLVSGFAPKARPDTSLGRCKVPPSSFPVAISRPIVCYATPAPSRQRTRIYARFESTALPLPPPLPPLRHLRSPSRTRSRCGE